MAESSEEEAEDSRDSDSHYSSNDRHSSRQASRTNFTNALLRVGTKSTKDSSLDKPVRKGAGLLLEAAGRSLLQKASKSSLFESNSNSNNSNSSNLLSSGTTIGGLSFGLASSKISFGLYGGHLPVDHGEYTKPKSKDTSPSRDESDGEGESSQRRKDAMSQRQKVFSNWGGEFFKKNLDYRANTNKILEKMNLTKNGAENKQETGLMSMAKPGGSSKRPFDGGNEEKSPSKRLKSSFLNTYS